MKRCDQCHKIIFTDTCLCKRFEVNCEWYGVENEVIWALDEEAAEKWAEELDSDGDYPIISSGKPTEVLITNSEGETKKFEVIGEAEPQYTATEID